MSDIKKLQNLYRDHCEVCLIGLLLKNVGAKLESLSTLLLGLGHHFKMTFSTVLEQKQIHHQGEQSHTHKKKSLILQEKEQHSCQSESEGERKSLATATVNRC